MRYVFELKCPRCKRDSEITFTKHEPLPVVNCGECLFNDVEVVELTVVRILVEAT